MTKLKKVDGLGFGDRADMYNLGRKGYTPLIFDFIELETGVWVNQRLMWDVAPAFLRVS